jgi:hypothetical protein
MAKGDSGVPKITILAFLRSQDPDKKTDYQNFIAPTDYPEITKLFTSLHDSIHRNFPKHSIWLSFPVETDDVKFLCQCWAYPTQRDGSRPYLSLCCIAAAVDELIHYNVDPGTLFCLSDLSRILEMKEGPTIERTLSKVGRNRSHPKLVDAYKAVLRGKDSRNIRSWPENCDGDTLMESIWQAIRDIPNDLWYQVSIGVGLPIDMRLPIPMTLTIGERPVATNAPAISSNVYSGRRRLQLLEQVADQLSKTNLPTFWQFRLWNICQDLLVQSEACLSIDDKGNQVRAARNQLGIVKQLYEQFYDEITRAKVDNLDNTIRSDLSTWFHDFERSLVSLQPRQAANALLNRSGSNGGTIYYSDNQQKESLWEPILNVVLIVTMVVVFLGLIAYILFPMFGAELNIPGMGQATTTRSEEKTRNDGSPPKKKSGRQPQ